MKTFKDLKFKSCCRDESVSVARFRFNNTDFTVDIFKEYKKGAYLYRVLPTKNNEYNCAYCEDEYNLLLFLGILENILSNDEPSMNIEQ